MTQQEVLQQLVEVRIKRVLLRTHQQYERELYNQVGRGVTVLEYAAIVEKLITEGTIARTVGPRGAAMLQLIEAQQG
jgi:hypothetical protein